MDVSSLYRGFGAFAPSKDIQVVELMPACSEVLCREREASAGTVANEEGALAKTWEMTAKRSCTMVEAGRARRQSAAADVVCSMSGRISPSSEDRWCVCDGIPMIFFER